MTEATRPSWPEPSSPQPAMGTLHLVRLERGLDEAQALAGSGLTLAGLESLGGEYTSGQRPG